MHILIKIKILIDNITGSISQGASDLFQRVNWLYARLFIIAIEVIPRFFVPNSYHPFPPNFWMLVALQFIFSVIGLQLIMGILTFNLESSEKWTLPSWTENPFNFKQPIQFFHFVGWLILISSTSSLSFDIKNLFLPTIMAMFGVGVLLGVKLSVLLYRNKFKIDEQKELS